MNSPVNSRVLFQGARVVDRNKLQSKFPQSKKNLGAFWGAALVSVEASRGWTSVLEYWNPKINLLSHLRVFTLIVLRQMSIFFYALPVPLPILVMLQVNAYQTRQSLMVTNVNFCEYIQRFGREILICPRPRPTTQLEDHVPTFVLEHSTMKSINGKINSKYIVVAPASDVTCSYVQLWALSYPTNCCLLSS